MTSSGKMGALTGIVDRIATPTAIGTSSLFRVLPRKALLTVLTRLIRLISRLKPKYRAIADTNLQIAFPDLNEDERAQLISQHERSFARFLTDSFSLRSLDDEWISEHISFPRLHDYHALHEGSETGILIATGHLGSFELMAHSAPYLGSPLSYVVRNFSLPRLDAWWCREREQGGNRIIRRKGAYKEIVRTLRSGRDVGILFDQNVTKNHSIFVPWFDKEAATTKALALAALQVQCPLVVTALCYKENENYELLWEECEVRDIYEDETLSRDEKIYQITLRATEIFTGFIKRYPAQWFWMHRRWRTRPEGDNEPIY